MKFGDSLTQRSIPAWRSYNIDYNSIKRFIKDSTIPGKGKAVSIPGRGDDLSRQSEDELFALFQAECSRVSLFVRSKRYELGSRLGSIERQLDQAARRNGILTPGNVNPQKALRLRQRYSKIESDILSVGQEIQKLSRFTAINRTAVRKLLKKQRKWSGNTTLGPRVEEEVLNKPDCFFGTQLQPCLERYAIFLERVRVPFTSGGQGTQTDGAADAAESTRRLGGQLSPPQDATGAYDKVQKSRQSIFWVHRDNVTELKILLLQHMRAPRRLSTDSGVSVDQLPSEFATRRSSRRVSTTELGRDVSVIMANEVHRDSSQTSTTSSRPNWPWHASRSTTFRWERCPGEEDRSRLRRTNPSPNTRSSIQQSTVEPGSPYDPHTVDMIVWEGESYDEGWQWLQNFSGGPPIAHTSFTATKYQGLGNACGSGSWAWLKENIEFSKLRPDAPLEEARSHSIADHLPKKDIQSFPHAVFEIVSTGEVAEHFVSTLQRSHLTERVQGFSLDEHAMATLCQPKDSQPPSWFSLLTKDIRHIPDNVANAPRRQGSNGGYGSSSSSTLQGTPQASSQPATSPTNAINSVSYLKDQQRPDTEKLQQHEQKEVRYWNEFDNPESEAGDFTLYIDPDAPIFPGQVIMTRWYNSLRDKFQSGSTRGRRAHRQHASSRSLSNNSISNSCTASSDDEADDELSGFHPRVRKPLLPRHRAQNGYGALPLHHRHLYPDDTNTGPLSSLTQANTSTLCLLASVLILLCSAFLTFTSRRKLRGEVDIAIVISVAASLCFAGIGAIRWWTSERPARGDLIENFGLIGRESARKSAKEYLRACTRRLSDVLKVVAMIVVVLGSAGVLAVAFR